MRACFASIDDSVGRKSEFKVGYGDRAAKPAKGWQVSNETVSARAGVKTRQLACRKHAGNQDFHAAPWSPSLVRIESRAPRGIRIDSAAAIV